MKALTTEQYFYVQDGKVLTSLEDLYNALPEISDETFAFHVNKEKNDFYNWLTEVLEETELAKSIKKIKTKASFQKKIKEVLATA